MNPLIERIYQSGLVEDGEGKTYPCFPSALTYEAGKALYRFVRTVKPHKTLETGMAYGLSTLFLCQAHRDNQAGTHTAIDPFQASRFRSIGVLNIARAELDEICRVYQEPSHQVLPRLYGQNEQFDFALIDGNHLFDYVLVDWFFMDKVLAVGGHVAVDDLWLPAVRRATSFVLHNLPYRLVRPNVKGLTAAWRGTLRIGRRIWQNPLGRDWSLKVIPQNLAFLQKVGNDTRTWRDYHPF